MEDKKTYTEKDFPSKSWKNYIIQLPFFLIYVIATSVSITYIGKYPFGDSINPYMIYASDLWWFFPILFAVFTVRGWFTVHQRFVLDDHLLSIRTIKDPFHDYRILLQAAPPIRSSSNFEERLLKLAHIEIVFSNGKTQELLSGFSVTDAEQLARLIQERIEIARIQPLDTLLADPERLLKMKYWQRIGMWILGLFFVLTAGFIYFLSQL